jgi:hypothetical protein
MKNAGQAASYHAFHFVFLALAIELPQVNISGLDPHLGISVTVFCLQYLQFLPICLLVIYLLVLFMVLRLPWFDFVPFGEIFSLL